MSSLRNLFLSDIPSRADKTSIWTQVLSTVTFLMSQNKTQCHTWRYIKSHTSMKAKSRKHGLNLPISTKSWFCQHTNHKLNIAWRKLNSKNIFLVKCGNDKNLDCVVFNGYHFSQKILMWKPTVRVLWSNVGWTKFPFLVGRLWFIECCSQRKKSHTSTMTTTISITVIRDDTFWM